MMAPAIRAIAALLLFYVGALAITDVEEVTLGILLPFNTSIGERNKKTNEQVAAIKLAFAEIISEDDGADTAFPMVKFDLRNTDLSAETARKALRDMLTEDTADPSLVAIIGASFSSVSMAINAALSMCHAIPQISATSTNKLLSDKANYPTFMRASPTDVEQGKALATLVAHYGWTKVVVFHTDSGYAKGLAADFANAIDKLGADVATIALTLTMTAQSDAHAHAKGDIDRQLDDIKASDVAVVLFVGQLEDAKFVLREAACFGLTGQAYAWIGVDGWMSDAFFADGLGAVDCDMEWGSPRRQAQISAH